MIAVKFMCTSFDGCIVNRKMAWLASNANGEMKYSKINTHSSSEFYLQSILRSSVKHQAANTCSYNETQFNVDARNEKRAKQYLSLCRRSSVSVRGKHSYLYSNVHELIMQTINEMIIVSFIRAISATHIHICIY